MAIPFVYPPKDRKITVKEIEDSFLGKVVNYLVALKLHELFKKDDDYETCPICKDPDKKRVVFVRHAAIEKIG